MNHDMTYHKQPKKSRIKIGSEFAKNFPWSKRNYKLPIEFLTATTSPTATVSSVPILRRPAICSRSLVASPIAHPFFTFVMACRVESDRRIFTRIHAHTSLARHNGSTCHGAHCLSPVVEQKNVQTNTIYFICLAFFGCSKRTFFVLSFEMFISFRLVSLAIFNLLQFLLLLFFLSSQKSYK